MVAFIIQVHLPSPSLPSRSIEVYFILSIPYYYTNWRISIRLQFLAVLSRRFQDANALLNNAASQGINVRLIRALVNHVIAYA